MIEVVLYTDGSCPKTDGPGGWAFVMVHIPTGKEYVKSGHHPRTTNNRMELAAVIEGLKVLTRPTNVEIVSDSQYVVKGLGAWSKGQPMFGGGWMAGWREQGWTKNGDEVKNVDLWKIVYDLVQQHDMVLPRWIKGHSGHVYNERCDRMAGEATRGKIIGSDRMY